MELPCKIIWQASHKPLAVLYWHASPPGRKHGQRRWVEDYGLVVGHAGGMTGFTGGIFYAADYDTIVVILHGCDAFDMEQIYALRDIAAQTDE